MRAQGCCGVVRLAERSRTRRGERRVPLRRRGARPQQAGPRPGALPSVQAGAARRQHSLAAPQRARDQEPLPALQDNPLGSAPRDEGEERRQVLL